MCERCNSDKISFGDFLKQEKKFKKEKATEENKTYVCSKCGTKYRLTKSKVLSEFSIRFLCEITLILLMTGCTMLTGLSELFSALIKTDNLIAGMCGLIYALVLAAVLDRLSVLVDCWINWRFSKAIKWYIE